MIPPSSEKLQRASIEVRGTPVKKQYDHYNHGFWSPDRPTVVYVESVPIGLCIVEMSESVVLRYVRGKYIRESEYMPPKSSQYYTEHTWTTTKDLPSGRIRLIAYTPSYRPDWQHPTRQSQATMLRHTGRSDDGGATHTNQFPVIRAGFSSLCHKSSTEVIKPNVQ